MLGEHVEQQLRLLAGFGFQEAARRQALEVGEAGRVLRQQHQRVGRQVRASARGASVRASAIWQPMIGWMPLAVQAWLNSSAPNRLPVSVMATAGIAASRARAAIFSALMAPSLSE